MDWLKLFETVGTTGVVVVAVVIAGAWVLREYGKNFFKSMENERHANFNRDLEKFKFELQAVAFEHQTKFKGVYDKRAEVIGELYSRITLLKMALDHYVRPFRLTGDPTEDVIFQNTATAYNDYTIYYHTKNIYFKKEIRDALLEVASSSVQILFEKNSMNVPKEQLMVMNTFAERKAHSQRIQDSISKITGLIAKIEDLRNKLLVEFQTILGVEETINPS